MSDWQLIYEIDSAGSVLNGSLSALRGAVMHAADVKVVYYKNSNWWSRECSSVCVYGSGENAVISATYAEALDTERDASGLLLASPVVLEQHIYNSTGVRRSATGGEIDPDARLHMRWYVRDYHIDWILAAEAFALLHQP